MTSLFRRRLIPVGAAVAAMVAAVGGCGIGQAGQQSAPAVDTPAVSTVLPADRTYTVTLLTGDVVTVHTRQSGCPTVTVRLAVPNNGYRTNCGPDGHMRVIPGSATRLMGRVLDEDLFDVTTLIKEGYDDASSTTIPLIMRAGQTRGAAPALADQRTLPSIGAVAGRQPKSGAAGFVATLAEPAVRSASEGPRVWLDHRVRATQDADSKNKLDANLRQVRAPQAWAAGHTGSGARVAVLDTGADPTHPDLAGKIAEQADFTADGGDAVDRHGHGTHTAATVAGSGAGSGGARRGVAPDAQLVIGKVLHDDGGGWESEVIAGMEWAATRAKVVNMSLGGGPSDGTDPLSMALEHLSQQHGTLFVVAAGNDGPVESTVSTPAVAPAALAVGAVDSQDALAEFSSRGPVSGSRVLKPEIVAPGVDIIAARAAGTTMGTPVDPRYTQASGTSMAAPHVAGAAAILVQQHPDWDARRLKAALVGATDRISGDPYEIGAGRLNVARATGSVVSSVASVDLGTFAYPQSGTAEAKVGWTNVGTKAVRVNLDVRLIDRFGNTTKNPAVTLSTTSVSVAAGGAESAVLRLDRARLAEKPGLYTAMITATWPGGGTASTPVSFYVEPRSHDLTLTSTPAPGTPADREVWTDVVVANLDDGALFFTFEVIEPGASLRLRVPAGRYSIMGNVSEYTSAGLQKKTLTGDPDVTVDADTTMNLDSSAAEPVAATVDGVDTAYLTAAAAFIQYPRRGTGWAQGTYVWDADAPTTRQRLYVTPMAAGDRGSFAAYEGFALATPDGKTRYDLIKPLGDRFPDDLTYRVTAAEHARLARIDERFHTLDAPGIGPSHRRIGETNDGLALVDADHIHPLPPTRVDYVSPDVWWNEISGTGVDGTAFLEKRQQYAAGSRQEKVWVRQPLRHDWFGEGTIIGECRPATTTRTSTLLRVFLTELTDQHDRSTCLDSTFPSEWADNTTRSMTLYRNGVAVGTHASHQADFPMSKQAADYRLTYDLDAAAVLPVSTKVSTAWTFRSAAPQGATEGAVPLLSVDYALPLDQNNHPTNGEAGFTVHQMPGAPTQNITRFEAWTSTDDGTTWTPVDVRKVDGDKFAAQLPQTSTGQAVSLRIAVAADRGSGIEQTIIRAYRTA
jgi:subtilisin family serine protease